MVAESHWRGLSAAVTGAAHMRNGRPMQDALRIEAYDGVLVAAVADGHGSDACPFSAEGAQAAVDCVHELFSAILAEAGAEAESVIADARELRLPRQLAAAWRQRVEERHRTVRGNVEFSHLLYGTTVMCVVASSAFLFALQLGDGDILAVEARSMDGPFTEDVGGGGAYWLIPPEYMPGNETHSLCQPDCWQYMRTYMVKLEAQYPADDGVPRGVPDMLMLTTDGYANSFMTDEGFLKAGADIHDLLLDEGAAYIDENLTDWLTRSSSEGSGDDIAMALVYRENTGEGH